MADLQTGTYLDDLPPEHQPQLPPTWENVASRFRERFPAVDQESIRREYDQSRQLAIARARVSTGGGEDALTYFGRRSVPFLSAVTGSVASHEYGQSRDRVRQGTAQPHDYHRVAAYEEQQHQEANQGTVSAIGSALAHAPAIVGEFAAGGAALGGLGVAAEGTGLGVRAGLHLARTAAITPLIPSSYLPQLAEDNLAAGRSAADPRGLPAALGVSYVNNLILGGLSAPATRIASGPGIGRIAARAIISTGTGVAEQAAADVLTGAAGFSAGYGTLGDLWAGRYGDALKHATVQAATFAAFGAMHEIQNPRARERAIERMKDVAETLKDSQELGLPKGKAAEVVKHHFPEAEQLSPKKPEENQVATPDRLENAPTETAPAPPAEQPMAPTPAETPPNAGTVAKTAVTVAKTAVPEAPRVGIQDQTIVQDAIEALRSTGFKAKEAKATIDKAIATAEKPFESVQELITAALPKPKVSGLGREAGGEGEVAPAPPAPKTDWLGRLREKKAAGAPRPGEPVLKEVGREHETTPQFSEKWGDLESFMKTPAGRELTADQKWQIEAREKGLSFREMEAQRPDLGSYETQRKSLNKLRTDAGFPEISQAAAEAQDALQRRREIQGERGSTEVGDVHRERASHAEGDDLAALHDRYIKLQESRPDKTLTPEEHQQWLDAQNRLIRKKSVQAEPEVIAAVEKNMSRIADPIKAVLEVLPEASRKEVRELIKLIQENRDAERSAKAAGYTESSNAEGASDQGKAAATTRPDNATEAREAPGTGQPPNDSGLGANAAAPRGQATGLGVGKQFDNLVKQIVRESTPVKQIGGGQSAVAAPGVLEKARQKAVEIVHGFRDEVDRLSGKMFPAITRIHREIGEAAARWVSAPVAAKIGAPVMIDRVFGENTKPETAQHWMDVFHEERARHNKDFNETEAERHRKEGVALIAAGKGNSPEALEAAGKHANRKQMAKDVHSFLGKEYSVPDEATYQKTLASPEYQAFKKRWNSEMVPLQEANYKGAQGMDEHADIYSPSQLPGHAFNAIAERDPAVAMNGLGARGNLNNVKLKNNPFANEATMAAGKYNTNYGDIITRTLAIGEATARKAEFIRLGVDQGEMEFAKPGQVGLKLPLGQESIEIKNVKPPKGTQDAALGETSLYVNKDMYQEIRQALQVDQSLNHGLVKHISDALTKTTLASSAETVYHFKNLLTALFKPGVNPLGLFSNMAKVMRGDMVTRKRLVELARIGVGQSTEHGLESGSLWGGKTDPTTWSSKFLHVISDSIRLTGEQAFESLANRGVEMTETNKRDFINQMTGQYNKAAQSKIVVWLRDIGLSPFATAASKFYMSGLQTLTGTHGLKTTGIAADIGLRAEVYGRIGLVLGSVALINFLKWGNPLGDDDTPLGAVKLGTAADGKTSYFDLTSLTGLTRGARSAGLLALAEGVRKDQSPGRILDRASDQMISSLIHIAEGPVVSFGHTLATGRNALGNQITETPPPSGSHFTENLKASLGQANPLIGALSGVGERRGNEQTPGQRALGLLGPFGPKFHGNEIVTELHQHLQDLTDARTLATRRGERFDQEREYNTLHRFSLRIAKLEHRIQGDVHAGRRWFGRPAEKPDEGFIRETRQRQAELARAAMEAVR